jgi:transposase-like protein
MMPCRFCGLSDESGKDRPGIRQVGRTKYDGDHFIRKYRCADCGATLELSGDGPIDSLVYKWTPTEKSPANMIFFRC